MSDATMPDSEGAAAAHAGMPLRRRPFGQRYAFVVVAVIFLCLLGAAGLRAAPGVLIVPLEQSFGWSRAVTSVSAAIGIFLYGLVGPFAAALTQSFGVRRTLMAALALMALATLASAGMSQAWQYVLTWGVLSGLGSGCVAIVLAATIVNRWFVTRRGTVMGLLTASTATGTLIFLPGMAALAEGGGWRPVVVVVGLVMAALIPIVWLLLPEHPQDAGLMPYGAAGPVPRAQPLGDPLRRAVETLAMAARHRTFWLLFASFFICGFTTNGLVGTHLIAYCADNGIPEVRAAGLLALMGLFDLVGTTASGWLTDRFDARKLLFTYYGLRGLALLYLPFSGFSVVGLSAFAVFYGLDWIATVPPTVRLANEAFGDRDAPVVFGWIAAGHQLGAASAAGFGGMMRLYEGRYLEAFVAAACTALVASLLSLMVRRRPRPAAFAPA